MLAWNSGLKGKNDPRCRSNRKGKNYNEIFGDKSIEIRKKLSIIGIGKNKGIGKTFEKEQERRSKISLAINKKYESGWLPRAGRCKKIKYYSPIAGQIIVDGTWELLVAQWLDAKKYNWYRNKKRFLYIKPNDKNGHYTPDFYINDINSYLEVKGYETELDRCKWKQFKEKLIIFKKEEIDKIKKDKFLNNMEALIIGKIYCLENSDPNTVWSFNSTCFR